MSFTDVAQTLNQLNAGTPGVQLALRSGESVTGKYQGVEGGVVRLEADSGMEEIEVEEIIGVYLEGETQGTE